MFAASKARSRVKPPESGRRQRIWQRIRQQAARQHAGTVAERRDAGSLRYLEAGDVPISRLSAGTGSGLSGPPMAPSAATQRAIQMPLHPKSSPSMAGMVCLHEPANSRSGAAVVGDPGACAAK